METGAVLCDGSTVPSLSEPCDSVQGHYCDLLLALPMVLGRRAREAMASARRRHRRPRPRRPGHLVSGASADRYQGASARRQSSCSVIRNRLHRHQPKARQFLRPWVEPALTKGAVRVAPVGLCLQRAKVINLDAVCPLSGDAIVICGVATRAWSPADPPGSRTPGVTMAMPGPTVARTCAASSPEATTPSQPASCASCARRITSSSAVPAWPCSARSAASRLVSTVTARMRSEVPALPATAAFSVLLSWPCTVRNVAPVAAALFHGALDRVADVEQLHVEEDLLARRPPARAPGPGRRSSPARGRPCRTSLPAPAAQPARGRPRRLARRARRSTGLVR